MINKSRLQLGASYLIVLSAAPETHHEITNVGDA